MGRDSLRTMRVLLAVVALVVLPACRKGPLEPEAWLLSLGYDTVTVEDAALRWWQLEEDDRRSIQESDDPVAEYVIWLARREMILREVQRLGYMQRPEVDQLVRTELRSRLAAAASDTARSMLSGDGKPADAALGELRDSLLEEAMAGARIDTAALVGMAASVSRGGFRPDCTSVVLSRPGEQWTEMQLMSEVLSVSMTGPVDPSDPQWLQLLARRLLLQDALVDWLQTVRPGAVDSVVATEGEVRRKWSMDLIHREMVWDSVEVGRREVEERYASLSEPLNLPERRRLQIVSFPMSRSDLFRRLAEKPDESPLDSFAPCPLFRDDESAEGLTVALSREQLPDALGDTIFSLPPEDTARWLGPFGLPGIEIMVGFRLREVLPPREATLEEAYDSLQSQILAEKAESRLEEWMTALEERYDLRINDAILDRLPPDPALWRDL